MKQIDSPQLVFGDVSKGVVASVGSRLAPASSVAHAVNFEFDSTIGEATVRKGTDAVGTGSLSGAAHGLFQFVDSEAGANSRLLLTGANGTTFYLNGSDVWTSALTGDTAGLKTRFATFLDRVVRVNGTDACKAWNGGIGTAWETSGGPLDIGNMPRGKYVMVYKDQVLTAGVTGYPDTVYISSVPDSSTMTISWSSGNRSITVNPDDRGNITGFGKIGNVALIFKDDGMFRWNNRATDADQVIDVGCSSQESVCVGGDVLTFWNRDGAWLTKGEYPVCISKPIQPWIDAVSADELDDVATGTDGDHFFYSVGNVTKDGRTFSNVVFRYSINTHEWAVYSYAKRFTFLTSYKDGTEVKLVGATDDADCQQIELATAYDDDGTPIHVEMESHDLDFGSRAIVKEASESVFAYGQNLPGFTVQCRTDKGDWKALGDAKGELERLVIPAIRGNKLRFRVAGTAPGAVCRFSGLELPKITYIGYGAGK
jgi:hypothetical protein